jgi:hypothetical protein
MDQLTWVYLVVATLVIVHEIDSAYWKEWELLRLPGGSEGFLFVHVPIVALLLVGLLHVHAHTLVGYCLALLLAASGLCAFGIHLYFLRKGRPEFKTTASILILGLLLPLSAALALFTIRALMQGTSAAGRL